MLPSTLFIIIHRVWIIYLIKHQISLVNMTKNYVTHNIILSVFWNAYCIGTSFIFRGGAVARTGGYFQSGVGNILLDEVNCIGTERSILQCLHAGLLSADCGHHEDAGVTCKGVQSAGILRGKHLIIVNGNNPVLANLSQIFKSFLFVSVFRLSVRKKIIFFSFWKPLHRSIST